MLFSTRYVWFIIPTINGSPTCTLGDNSLRVYPQGGLCNFEFIGLNIAPDAISSNCESDGVPIGSETCLTTSSIPPTVEQLKRQQSESLHAEIHNEQGILAITCFVRKSGFLNRMQGKRALIGTYRTRETNELSVEKSGLRRALNVFGLDVGPKHSKEKALRICRDFVDRRKSVEYKLGTVDPTIEW